ncbi:MAG: hypothetical protein ACREUT_18295 [Steroidobacteraceae bacterium]
MSVLRMALAICALIGTASAFPADSHRQRVVYIGGGPTRSGLFLSSDGGRSERPLIPMTWVAYDASFSADGSWIIFTSERLGSADIFRVHVDGSAVERLTDSPAFDDQGALSPDGKTLAFVSTRGGGTANVWLLDLTRHRSFDLTKSDRGNFRPSWSPDGKWIAFTSDRDMPHGRQGPDRPPPRGSGCCGWELVQSTALYIVHPDGSGLRRLTPPGRFVGSPKWSADGTHIVYYFDDRTLAQKQARSDAVYQIVSIDITSAEKQVRTSGPGLKQSPQYIGENRIAYLTWLDGKTTLADTSGWKGPQAEIANPSWSPDGRLVVYTKEGNDGTQPNPIVKVASRDPAFDLYRASAALAYSPDGRRVLYSGAFVGDKALKVMNADGTDHVTLFEAKARNVGIVSPSWSPDGSHIVFTMGRYGLRNPNTPAQLAMVRSDGSDLKILTQGTANSGYASFSPDGKRLVFRVLGSEQGLRILSLQDGNVTKLTTEWDNFPAWSPRGDRILFTGFRTGDFEIYTIRPDGSGLRQLTHDHGNDAHALWSADGKSILFTSSRMGWKDETGGGQSYGEVFVMREDGTHLRQLTDDRWEESADAWLPPSKGAMNVH